MSRPTNQSRLSKDEDWGLEDDKSKSTTRPAKTPKLPWERRIKKFRRTLWTRFALLPFVAALPVAFLLTGLNTSWDYGEIASESFGGEVSPTIRSYHVKLGYNYTILAVFALLVSVGLFQLANTVITRLETSYEQINEK